MIEVDPERLRALAEDVRVRARQHASSGVLAFHAAVGVEHLIAGHDGPAHECAPCVQVVHQQTLDRMDAGVALIP